MSGKIYFRTDLDARKDRRFSAVSDVYDTRRVSIASDVPDMKKAKKKNRRRPPVGMTREEIRQWRRNQEHIFQKCSVSVLYNLIEGSWRRRYMRPSISFLNVFFYFAIRPIIHYHHFRWIVLALKSNVS